MEEKSEPAPAMRLLIRSKMGGVELLGAPDPRVDGGTLAAVGMPLALGASRNIVVVAPDGRLVACNGGGAPLEVFATRGDSAVVRLPASTASIERFDFSPLGSYLVTWERPDPVRLPEGSLRVWELEGARAGEVRKSFHCKLLNKGGIPATLAWSGDEAIAFHSVTNTLHVHDGHFALNEAGSDQRGSVSCPGVSLFAASLSAEPPFCAALFVPEVKGRPAAVKIHAFPPPAGACGAEGLVVAKSFSPAPRDG